MQDCSLAVAEKLQQEIAAARLAEPAVHALFVDHSDLFARQTGSAESGGKLVAKFLESLLRRHREEREDVVQIDRAGDVAGSECLRRTGIDHHCGQRFRDTQQLPWCYQNVMGHVGFSFETDTTGIESARRPSNSSAPMPLNGRVCGIRQCSSQGTVRRSPWRPGRCSGQPLPAAEVSAEPRRRVPSRRRR